MATSNTTTSNATPKAAYLRTLVEARINSLAEHVSTGALSPGAQQKVELLAEEMMMTATDAAKWQGERFIPLTRVSPNDVRKFFRYSRQDPGSPVFPYHALTPETFVLFSILYNEGFTLEQQYTGPRVLTWDETGPQQLLLRW